MHQIVCYRFKVFLALLFNLSLQLKWGTRTTFEMNATQLTEQRINISLLSCCGHSRSRAHVILDDLGKQQYEAFCILDLSCLIPIELTHMYTTHRAWWPCFVVLF